MQEDPGSARSCGVAQLTPDSVVEVNGTVFWQIVNSNPAAIKFAASDDEVFQAGVVDKEFSVCLPNMMPYEVSAEGANTMGHGEWHYSHQLQMDAGTNVIGIAVALGR